MSRNWWSSKCAVVTRMCSRFFCWREVNARRRRGRAARSGGGAQLTFGHGRRPSGYAEPPLQLANRDRRDRQAGKELGGRRVTGRGT
eukprot:scaffold44249_cov66-Phaeocystis_antarctica.AAC.1